AQLGGGVTYKTGTSLATPIISGIVALLLSIQIENGEKPDPLAVRDALLQSALPCDLDNPQECRRFLAGRVNIAGARQLLGSPSRFHTTSSSAESPGIRPNSAPEEPKPPREGDVTPVPDETSNPPMNPAAAASPGLTPSAQNPAPPTRAGGAAAA